jgi:hypothetical protein
MSAEVFLQSLKIDPHAESIILSSPAWAAKLVEITNAAAQAAVDAFEGAGPHPYETGEYVGSIRGYVGFEDGKFVGRVIADDFKAWWIEVGTSDTPTFAPLQRGADSIGLKVEAGHG